MVSSPILRLKQGAQLALDLRITDDLGNSVDLTGATVTVVLADALGNLVATLPMTAAAEQGWGTISSATSTWPIGALSGECHVVVNGTTEISDTFSIVIERPVSA